MLLLAAAMVAYPAGVGAQDIEAAITIDPAAATAAITGRWLSATGRSLSFLPSAIGVSELGRRIRDVALSDAGGRPVAHRAFNSAEYVAEADFVSFSYKLDLKPSADPRSAAHSSWIGREEGLILLDDVLPQAGGAKPKGAVVSLAIADGWGIASTDRVREPGVYRIENVERAVFVIGKSIRRAISGGENDRLAVAVSGRWLFDDADAGSMAAEIFQEYVKVFGQHPTAGALVVLLPVPQAGVQKGVWEAETRGSTVVIASSDMAFKTQSLQRVHEQLRHEMFHLWMPNGVNLTGRYDWFYEGFALYQSLRTGVALNRIRFEDLLDTLSRAHNIDRSQAKRRSLIEASRERWNGADTQLYARGMLVAFLCDIVLLQGSKGKASVESILAKLFTVHRHPAAAADANTAVLGLLESEPGLAVLARDYIRGDKPIEWAGILDAAGLENEPATSRTKLRIKPKVSGRQKALLDKLGYNNWRKLTRK